VPDRALSERLARRIRAAGPITFAEFMEAALYDPAEGFYARTPVGERGDFVTAPHVSPVFGRLVARQVTEFWELLERPDRFTVLEVGAGDGTLAHQIVSAIGSDLREGLRYVPIERTAAGREALRAKGFEPERALAETMPAANGCVLANELVDNLPFHWVRRTERGLVEIHVGLDGTEGLAFVDGPLSTPDLADFAPDLEPGRRAVVSPAAVGFVAQAARALNRGYVWIADYGFRAGERAEEPHGYLAQRLQADVLSDPGSRDITAGVDFEALVQEARRLGLATWGPVTQRDALLNLGFRELAEEARARQVEAVGTRRGIDALRIYSDRTRANLLMAEGGLGDFLVLCMGVGTERPPRSVVRATNL